MVFSHLLLLLQINGEIIFIPFSKLLSVLKHNMLNIKSILLLLLITNSCYFFDNMSLIYKYTDIWKADIFFKYCYTYILVQDQ